MKAGCAERHGRVRVVFLRLLALWLLPAIAAFGQDERRVVSPNGLLEFRLFLAQPEGGLMARLAYRVDYRGAPLIETSFLGFDIKNQEPLLGENVGLMSSRTGSEARCNTLLAEFMQNGSQGRRIDVEARACNDGVAFRYRLPRSAPLDELFIRDEITEFAMAGVQLERTQWPAMPVIVARKNGGFVELAEGPGAGYPRPRLERESGGILITRLTQWADDPNLAWSGTTPMVFPWRAIVVAESRERLAQSDVLAGLNQ